MPSQQYMIDNCPEITTCKIIRKITELINGKGQIDLHVRRKSLKA
jgi:hypothetical protein